MCLEHSLQGWRNGFVFQSPGYSSRGPVFDLQYSKGGSHPVCNSLQFHGIQHPSWAPDKQGWENLDYSGTDCKVPSSVPSTLHEYIHMLRLCHVTPMDEMKCP